MLNKVMIIGHVGRDAEHKTFESSENAKFSVAVTKKWKNNNGEQKEKTEWINVVVWGKLANICAKYVVKGMKVFVEGELETTSYEKDGEKKYVTSLRANNVQFLSKVDSNNQQNTDIGEPSFEETFLNEEIPF